MGGTTREPQGAVARAEAITALYERDAAQVRRLVRRRANVTEAVLDEACQVAWMRLWAHADVSLRHEAAVKWLVVTATRHAWRERRREMVVQACGDVAELAARLGEAPDPADVVVARDDTRALMDRLRPLTERERKFLAMQAAGLSYREIGALTGATVRTVERQVLRGRRKLRAELEPRPMP